MITPGVRNALAPVLASVSAGFLPSLPTPPPAIGYTDCSVQRLN